MTGTYWFLNDKDEHIPFKVMRQSLLELWKDSDYTEHDQDVLWQCLTWACLYDDTVDEVIKKGSVVEELLHLKNDPNVRLRGLCFMR